ncbi:MAG: hypothetical protein GY845_30660 [Planctomycetes bacterium]|nr:hypothetical protein [Planctomycetota bacterium]
MIQMISYKVTILLLIVSMLTSVLACGGGGSSSPTPDNTGSTSSATGGNLESAQAQQINAIAQANTEEQRKPAIEEVVRQGFTLGLVDENGNQLNPNVPADSLSMTPEDVAAHAVMVPGGNYRTISYVVDSLAEASVVLASTEEVITIEDFLPDLQDYVDRSFDNPDDPESSLGLLIGSGHELEVPGSVPTINGETMISPLASLMMMADILLGIGESSSQNGDDVVSKVFSVFAEDAYADDKQNLASKVEGHITTIKGIFNVTEKSTEHVEFKEQAKALLALKELSNRLAIRVIHVSGEAALAEMIVEKKLNPTGILYFDEATKTQQISAVLIERDANDRNSVQLVSGMPTSFSLTLISPGNQLGLPLFPDANAELSASGDWIVDQNGHRLFGGTERTQNAPTHVQTTITATKLPADDPRSALLLISATINKEFTSAAIFGAIVSNESFDINDSKNTNESDFEKIITAMQPAPWVSTIILKASNGIKCEKGYFTDSDVLWWEGCTLNGEKHGLWINYYESGNKVSEGYYNEGKKDGFYTTYYSNPPNKEDCIAEYEDDELIWKKCYSTDGQVLSEITRDGILKDYYWSGRISKECRGTITEEIECQRFCDNEAHTLCDEFTLDDYGYPVNEEDGCDTMCD